SYNPNAVTLLDVIDKTQSPMGGRLLKRWIALPLKDIEAIGQRHDVVSFFVENPPVLEGVRQQIRSMSDLERLISKVATGKISPRELIYLKNSLDAILPLKALTMKSSLESVREMAGKLHECELLRQKIGETLNPEAPVAISKGNAIAKGISPELDDLRSIAYSGKEYLEGIEKRESEATGIASLKIAFNNVLAITSKSA